MSFLTDLMKTHPNIKTQDYQQCYIQIDQSKSDQIILLESAKKLLENESKSIQEILLEKMTLGFLGNGSVQRCSICGNRLGSAALVLTVCEHKFHKKCFDEDLKVNRDTIVSLSDDSDQCPICKRSELDIEDGDGKTEKKK